MQLLLILLQLLRQLGLLLKQCYRQLKLQLMLTPQLKLLQ
nr:MAG TPA: hypothetical protein [Caudoviricetes sp.]